MVNSLAVTGVTKGAILRPQYCLRLWDLKKTLGLEQGSSMTCLRLNLLPVQWDSGLESDLD